jgi:hypothetical protein
MTMKNIVILITAIIIIIIIIIIIVTLIQAIYNYAPRTHHVSTVRTAAAILQLQFMLQLLLLLLLLLLLFAITLFTIMHLEHTMSLQYVLLQLFCSYNLCYMQCYFQC